MSARAVTTCELCGCDVLHTVLDLGASPPTCNMPWAGVPTPTVEHHPLALLRCPDCGLVMLSVKVDPEQLFPLDYPYQSGNSVALHEHFAQLAKVVAPAPDDLLVDIGANDGTLLSKFGCRKVGVEPTGQADKIIADEVFFVPFSEEVARLIVLAHGNAAVVTASNVLAHVDDLADAMRGIAVLLGEHGVLYAENHDLAVVAGGQWDTVYHEHLRYFDPNSFTRLLAQHGLRVTAQDAIPTHGGSFRIQARKGTPTPLPAVPPYDFGELARHASQTRTHLRRMNDPLVGIGATARATTVMNYCGLDVQDVGFVAEVASSDKIGRVIPGTRVPVVDEAELLAEGTDAILFSWHLADTIVPALRARGYEGRIFAPLPHVVELP